MNALFQWTQHGSLRPMNDSGTEPAGDCQELPEGQPVLMGTGITDEGGNWSLQVRPALCVELGLVQDVSIVATPTQKLEPNDAVLLRRTIVTTAWLSFGGDLVFRVRSWELTGEPAPNVPFSWHATVTHVFVQNE